MKALFLLLLFVAGFIKQLLAIVIVLWGLHKLGVIPVLDLWGIILVVGGIVLYQISLKLDLRK